MEELFFSGYTRRENKGIHIFDVEYDVDGNIKFSRNQLIEESSPTYLAKSTNGDSLFSVTARGGGGVASYKKEDGKYILVDTLSSMLKPPCHLYFDEGKKLVYSSNYHMGRLDIIGVDNNLKLERMSTIQFKGKGKISPDQDSSKCHMSIKDPFDKYLIVIDLGDDAVHTYYITEDGNHRLISTYKTEAGMGPRHIIFSKDGRKAYLIGELNSKIDILDYDFKSGEFLYIKSISTLPRYFKGKNTAAAIKISKDGKFIYGSNRGHDSISVYKCLDNGKLEFIQNIKTGGKTPRDFLLSKDEIHIFVGHQDENYVTVFKRNKENGLILENEIDYINISEIVCIIE